MLGPGLLFRLIRALALLLLFPVLTLLVLLVQLPLIRLLLIRLLLVGMLPILRPRVLPRLLFYGVRLLFIRSIARLWP